MSVLVSGHHAAKEAGLDAALGELAKTFGAREEERFKALRRLSGRRVHWKIANVEAAGVLTRITEESLEIERQYSVNGVKKTGAPLVFRLDQLGADAWNQIWIAPAPSSPQEWVADALVALARERPEIALECIGKAGDWLGAAELKRYLDRKALEMKEAAARSRWGTIQKTAQPNAKQAKVLLAELGQFEREYGDLEFALALKDEREMLRRRLERMAEVTAGLIGYWKLDEASGNTAADSSGKGRDGTW